MNMHRFAGKNLLWSLGLALVFLLGSLLAAELFVRYWLPLYKTVYALDKHRLHRFQPDAWKIYTHNASNGGARVTVKINSLGYRGTELSDAPERSRIVVYGDSFIAAEYSALADTYVQQLANMLYTTGPPVEVINAGVTAYGPDQTSLYMQQSLAGLQADLVVVSIYAGNDFGDLMRNKLFKLSDDGNLQENDWWIAPALRERFARAESLFADSDLLNRSMLVRVSKKLYWALQERASQPGDDGKARYIDGALSVRQREYEQFINKGNSIVENLFGDGYDADISMEPESASTGYKVRLMEQVMLRIRDIANSEGIPLLFLFVPSPIDACEGYDYQVDAAARPAYRRTALTDRLQVIALRNNLSYVNLFENFHGSGCKSLYYGAGNNHWNERGQALASSVTAAYIKRNRMLGGQH
jgi:hypothetical protein